MKAFWSCMLMLVACGGSRFTGEESNDPDGGAGGTGGSSASGSGGSSAGRGGSGGASGSGSGGLGSGGTVGSGGASSGSAGLGSGGTSGAAGSSGSGGSSSFCEPKRTIGQDQFVNEVLDFGCYKFEETEASSYFQVVSADSPLTFDWEDCADGGSELLNEGATMQLGVVEETCAILVNVTSCCSPVSIKFFSP